MYNKKKARGSRDRYQRSAHVQNLTDGDTLIPFFPNQRTFSSKADYVHVVYAKSSTNRRIYIYAQTRREIKRRPRQRRHRRLRRLVAGHPNTRRRKVGQPCETYKMK